MASLQRNRASLIGGAPDQAGAQASGPRWTGELLRRKREALGLDVDEAAAPLRIKPRYLAALEAGHPEQLPGYAYALGFLRSYADWLGLDAGEVLRRFKEGANAFAARPDLCFPMALGEGSMRGRAALLTAALIAICGYGTWYFLLASETRRVERVAPVPAAFLPHAVPPPPAFGASIPADGVGLQSEPAAPSALSSAPPLPAPPNATQATKGRSPHKR